MNRHNFLQFNPNSYKQHLSPFGRNVLDTLIKHWRTGFDDNSSRRRDQCGFDQNRRNSTLRDCRGSSHQFSPVPSSPADGSHNDIHQGAQSFNTFPVPSIPPSRNLKVKKDFLPEVPIGRFLHEDDTHDDLPNAFIPSSVEHVITAETGDTNEDEILTANDMITPVINFTNKPYEKLLLSKQCIDKTDIPPEKFLKILNKDSSEIKNRDDIFKTRENKSEERNINWNDMFDTELFSEIKLAKPLGEPKEQNNANSFKILFPKANVNARKNIENSKMTTGDVTEERLNKRKNQTKITKTISKIVKKANCQQDIIGNEAKHSGRKIKYKKAVKNWLADVNPDNKVEEESFETNNLEIKKSENLLKEILQKDTIDGKATTASKATSSDNIEIDETNIEKAKTIGIDKNPNEEVKSTAQETFAQKEPIKIQKASKITSKPIFPPIEVEKNTNEKAKKVIQSRLAQRDGKMKFRLPNNEKNVTKIELPALEKFQVPQVTNESKSKEKNVTKIELPALEKFQVPQVTNESKSKEKNVTKIELPALEKFQVPQVNNASKSKETVKEKKGKPKFVAPIKSQIPVKNMTFDVCKIDETNVHMMEKMAALENNEVLMILVYNNGFCQLNNHHTEDTCVPEGILIEFNDQFFYLKGNVECGGLLKELLQRIHVICYNGKQILICLTSKYSINLRQSTFNITDTKIGGSLIDPDNPPENFTELQKLLGFTPEFTIATECALQKAAWYMTLLKECYARLRSLLVENSVWNVFIDIEMRLLPIITDMEYNGVNVDLDKLKSMEDILLRKLKTVEQECYKAAGKTFQINSTLQVRTILYDELQLDTKSNLKIKETIGKGAKSTSETMLRGLVSVHPLPRLILEYRHLHKAHATFVTGIAQHVKDGLVKPTWVQTAAATGRIASSNPNLQAIPKAPFSLTMFPDDADVQEPQLNFRSVYTSRPGHQLLAADFKHIECRVFAHAAADGALLDALRSGRDLFRVLAAKWLNKPDDEISSEDRERTKRIVYASLYGAGARKLMEILHVGYEQALAVMSSFNRTFPGLKAFGVAVVGRARAGGGALRSLLGRARRFPHIAGADAARRAHAERQAVNFLVQGSAADLCKKAMVSVEQRLQTHIPPIQGRLVLQIHDELVWEVLDEHLETAASIIKDTMENIGHQCGMAMTLPVEMSAGRSWGEMESYMPK